MDLTHDDDSVVYVTLIEAAEEIGASPNDLRKAVLEQQIDGIKENPRNQRSRWLVPLDAVRSLYSLPPGAVADEDDPSVSSEEVGRLDHAMAGDAGKDGENTDSSHGYSGAMEDDARDLVDDVEHVVMPDPEEGDQANGSIVAWDQQLSDDAAVLVPGRGIEMIDRLSQAIDRFAAAIPEPVFDYEEMLEKYVSAVERQADAEAVSASRLREIESLQKQVETHMELQDRYVGAVEKSAEAQARNEAFAKRIDDLEAGAAAALKRIEDLQVENRRLVSELEKARSHVDVSRGGTQNAPSRPTWRRRIGRASGDTV